MGDHFSDRQSYVTIIEVNGSFRRRIENIIESLVGLLDQIDGNADDEDGGDSEPSLGWTTGGTFAGSEDLEECPEDHDGALMILGGSEMVAS